MNETLIKIQNELSVPKSQRNTFGNYNYRSCEDILEAVKPLLQREGLLLTMTDEVVNVGDRNYVKVTAILSRSDSKTITDDMLNLIQVTAYAREEETKKGMDGSQITGASSSYARKYALNGLFLIDDNKDSDATNKHEDRPEVHAQTVPRALTQSSKNDVKCPKCGGEMWDNRTNKLNPNAPDFKCKDKECKDDRGYVTGMWESDFLAQGQTEPPMPDDNGAPYPEVIS